MATSAPATDRILPFTRIVSAVIAPFLVLAFAVLYPVPTDTKRLFAWAIKPSMSAMTLGAVYLGGAYFFVRVIRARQWHAVAGGFLPVGTFASLMGIATVLHWNRFIHGNLAFWLWVGLYFTTPFIVFAVFFVNRREYVPAGDGDVTIPRAVAAVMVAGGTAAVLTAAFLFLFPSRALDVWPWQLTPLTARVLGAIFALGSAGLGAYRERRWTAARLLLQVEAIMLVLILVAGARAHAEFDASRTLTWIVDIGFVAVTIATVAFYARMEGRNRDPGYTSSAAWE
jgi:hypothetical protein